MGRQKSRSLGHSSLAFGCSRIPKTTAVPSKFARGKIEALGTRILDNQVFDKDDAEIPENMKVLGEIKSPGATPTLLSDEDKGQLMDYLTRLLNSQPQRQFTRGFLTNLDYVILMEARRNTTRLGVLRSSCQPRCTTNVITVPCGSPSS